MSIIYFDAFSGAGGDMILSGLIHLGVDIDWIKKELKKLSLDDYKINYSLIKVNTIESGKINITYKTNCHNRNLSSILNIINKSNLNPFVKNKSSDIFNILASAEAKIHGTTKNNIHFHEVGAIDSIIDIVGSTLALYSLNLSKIICSPLPLSRGFINSSHGKLPLPAPASLEILKDFPCYGVNIEGELITPTAAAILKSWVNNVGDYPSIKVKKIGYGAGSIKRELANILRIVLGEKYYKSNIKKNLLLIESNIDDMSPEVIGFTSDKLTEIGVLEFFTNPITMKKGRSGIKLSVLLEPYLEDKVIEILYTETSSIGLKKIHVERNELKRENIIFNSSFGQITIKESYFNNSIVNYKPEYEELKVLSKANKIPLKELYLKIITEYKIHKTT